MVSKKMQQRPWCCWTGMEGTEDMMAYCGVYHVPASWKFCPICGTPRPEKKSLKDKLSEEFIRLYSLKIIEKIGYINWGDVANTAIEFLRDNKE